MNWLYEEKNRYKLKSLMNWININLTQYQSSKNENEIISKRLKYLGTYYNPNIDLFSFIKIDLCFSISFDWATSKY